MEEWTSEEVRDAVARLELSQQHHDRAIIDLANDIERIDLLVKEHAGALGRLERRLNAESKALDDHEKRICAFET